jgi:hypothetical protein
MQCKELEAVLEQEGLSPLPLDAREHLSRCSACQGLLADLSAIVVTAKRIPAEVNPPERIWVSLRAQLEAEGIIRETAQIEAQAGESWWQGIAQRFRPRVLATVAASLFVIVGGVYVAQRLRTKSPVATSPVPAVTQNANRTAPAPAQKTPEAPVRNPAPATQSVAVNKPPAQARGVRESTTELQPSPTEKASFGETAQALSDAEGALPSRPLANNAAVDASLRQNLRTLNEFIAECEARLRQNPQDQLTREYLNMAYQQKAELLTAMMDSGRSEQ